MTVMKNAGYRIQFSVVYERTFCTLCYDSLPKGKISETEICLSQNWWYDMHQDNV